MCECTVHHPPGSVSQVRMVFSQMHLKSWRNDDTPVLISVFGWQPLPPCATNKVRQPLLFLQQHAAVFRWMTFPFHEASCTSPVFAGLIPTSFISFSLPSTHVRIELLQGLPPCEGKAVLPVVQLEIILLHHLNTLEGILAAQWLYIPVSLCLTLAESWRPDLLQFLLFTGSLLTHWYLFSVVASLWTPEYHTIVCESAVSFFCVFQFGSNVFSLHLTGTSHDATIVRMFWFRHLCLKGTFRALL